MGLWKKVVKVRRTTMKNTMKRRMRETERLMKKRNENSVSENTAFKLHVRMNKLTVLIIGPKDDNKERMISRLGEILENKLSARRMYDWKVPHFVAKLFLCLSCRRRRAKGKLDIVDNRLLLEKGIEKYETEMDLCSILLTMRKVHWLMDTVLSKEQVELEKFSKYH